MMRGRPHVTTRAGAACKHNLAVLRHVEEISGNVSAWHRRFDGKGFETGRARHAINETKTDPDVIEKVLWPTGLPLRSPEDLDVLAPLPRHRDQPVERLAHPPQTRTQPIAGLQRYKRTQTQWKRYEKQRPGHQ